MQRQASSKHPHEGMDSTEGPVLPTRFVNVDPMRAKYGTRVDRLGERLLRGDPMADRAALAIANASLDHDERRLRIDEALQRPSPANVSDEVARTLADLVEDAAAAPFWFDPRRAEQGARAFVRTGMAGGLVLAFRSLVLGYVSPAGNKPLAFSGRLVEAAPRRLAETSHFVFAVTSPGGMAKGGAGFAAAIRVRLMHAEVRRQLQRFERWNGAAWGVPINQLDMAGTVLLFSHVVAEGLDRLGLGLAESEREDLLHLWRYVGHVLGVDADLGCPSEHDAAQLWDMIVSTARAPDDDSRSLARALVESPRHAATTPEARADAERRVRFAYGLSRVLLGDATADSLHYPTSRWTPAIRALRPVLASAAPLTRRPRLRALLDREGARYWRRVVDLGLAGVPATYSVERAIR